MNLDVADIKPFLPDYHAKCQVFLLLYDFYLISQSIEGKVKGYHQTCKRLSISLIHDNCCFVHLQLHYSPNVLLVEIARAAHFWAFWASVFLVK